MKRLGIAIGIGLVLVLVLAVGMPAWAQYQTKVYFDTNGDRMVVASGGELQMESGSTLDVQAGTSLSLSGTGSVTTTYLAINGVQVSGAYKYGTATAVSTGTTIAHGLGTTPTIALVQMKGAPTATTFFLWAMSTNATSITVGASGAGAVSANWFVGQ